MANEQLIQLGYYNDGKIKGASFGTFEYLNLGATTVEELNRVGVVPTVPAHVDFPFQSYTVPNAVLTGML